MTTSYERGRAIEYRIQRELEAIGYTTARAAGSKGKFDVLAWNDVHFRIIQAKSFIERPGSFADDVAQIRQILCPPDTRRELWVWQHRKGWQARFIIGNREEADCVLPITEPSDQEEGRYQPTVIGADGHLYRYDQRLPQALWEPLTIAEKRSAIGGRAFGTPPTINCVGTEDLRTLLHDLRKYYEAEGAEQVLFEALPKSKPRKA